MAKKNDYYFQFMIECAEFSKNASHLLTKTMQTYDLNHLEKVMDEMHEIEHAQDHIKNELRKNLIKEFITPIEREDILELAHRLDNVTDGIEEIVLRLYMFNISAIREDVKQFIEIIDHSCYALKEMMNEFAHFAKSDSIYKHIQEIKLLEETADKLYTTSVHRLFKESTDAQESYVWSELYNQLERCCDRVEHVANAVEMVILKNS